MSNQGPERSADSLLPEMDSLARAVDLAVAEVRAARDRACEAEERAERNAAMLRQFAEGNEDPGTLARRVEALEAENADLRGRIEQGRAGIDRILASMRFLEDRR
ncbi:MAG: hypothetical protein OXQ94_08930 [Gemmatimonadota bacterium]|nr:hypothetical protein [Gemmatimonadota bacterium]MDE2871794.1 hypothetical protein [Gemmatimonadota bacterium]